MHLINHLNWATNKYWDNCVAAVGMFDGMHRGHQTVIQQALTTARSSGAACVVVTFDRHPAEVVKPESSPPYLNTLNRRITHIAESGADILLVLPFTREFAEVSAEHFAYNILRELLGCTHLIIGDDFHFGKNREGNISYLLQQQKKLGFAITPVKAVCDVNERISSSRIRGLLSEGNIEAANHLLTRPYCLEGHVVQGEKLGRQIGFPTANLITTERQVIPANGIYAAKVLLEGIWYKSACSIGFRPTVGGTSRTLEAYLIDYNGGAFYGANIEVAFTKKLRDEKKYGSIEALKQQIQLDVDLALKVLEAAHE